MNQILGHKFDVVFVDEVEPLREKTRFFFRSIS